MTVRFQRRRRVETPAAPRLDRRLTVLMLSDWIEGGGAERIAFELALRLDPARFRSMVCTYKTPDGRCTEILRQAGIEVLVLTRRSRRSLRAWTPLLRLIRREHIDVLHTHKFGPNLWGAIIGTLWRVPTIVATEHSWSYQGQPLRKLLDREVIARFASAFVAVSEQDRRRMISVERVPAHKTRVIPTGLVPHPDPVLTARMDIRAELGLEADAPVIATVCVMRKEKRLDVLLRAFEHVHASMAKARLVLVGFGPERPAVEALIAELGLEDAVILAGRRDDVPALLAATDVFVLSSEREGAPLALLEAMAAGLPVVSTAVGSIPDIAGDAARLVPPGDPAALAAALAEVLGDAPLRAVMGRAGRERVAERYAFDGVVERWERLYTELAARALN